MSVNSNTWKSDRFIYKMLDHSYQSQREEFPKPAMAVELVARKGEEIPRELAARNGWIGHDHPGTDTTTEE